MNIHDILELEERLKLYDYVISDIPIWRLYRTKYRDKLLSKEGVKRKTAKTNFFVKFFAGFLNMVISIKDLFLLLFINRRHVDDVVFPFPRLHKVGDEYWEKFTDPVMKKSSLCKNSILFIFSFKKSVSRKRCNKDLCCHIDILYILANFLSVLVAPLILFSSSFKCIYGLYSNSKSFIPLATKDLFFFCHFYVKFKIYVLIWYGLFKLLHVKRLFCVVRDTFKHQIVAAHMLGIPVYEFQHGAVLGDTVLYSGPYNSLIDADYFLSYGYIWSNSNFGLPDNRILNIGWAYKEIISAHFSNSSRNNCILVISSPHISNRILDIILDLATLYPTYNFDIRCHPKEKYSTTQMNSLKGFSNVRLVDNMIESSIAIGEYKYVLGENSSVLYEAFSLGKIVGRLDFPGINIRKISNLDDEAFYFLKRREDFNEFISFKSNVDRDIYYSDFNSDLVNNLPVCR